MQSVCLAYYIIPAKWKLAICLFSLFRHFALCTKCSTEHVVVERNFKASTAEKLARPSLMKNYWGIINVYTYEARCLEKPVCLLQQGHKISLGYLYLLSEQVRTSNFRKTAHFRTQSLPLNTVRWDSSPGSKRSSQLTPTGSALSSRCSFQPVILPV